MTVKPALWWKTEGVKSLLPGKEKAQEYLIIVFQYLEGRHKEDGSTLFSISHTDKGKWVKVAPGDFFPPVRRINQKKNLLGDMGECLSLEFFMVQVDDVLGSLIEDLSHQRLNQMIFQGPFKPRLFYDSIIHCDFKIIPVFYTGDKFCITDNMFLKMGTTRARIILSLFLLILHIVRLCFLFLNEFPTNRVGTISLLWLANTKCVGFETI